jgi:hypothetical protein
MFKYLFVETLIVKLLHSCDFISAFQCIDDEADDDIDKENVEVMSVHSEELPEKCVKFDIDTHTTGHRNSEIRRSSQRSGTILMFYTDVNIS